MEAELPDVDWGTVLTIVAIIISVGVTSHFTVRASVSVREKELEFAREDSERQREQEYLDALRSVSAELWRNFAVLEQWIELEVPEEETRSNQFSLISVSWLRLRHDSIDAYSVEWSRVSAREVRDAVGSINLINVIVGYRESLIDKPGFQILDQERNLAARCVKEIAIETAPVLKEAAISVNQEIRQLETDVSRRAPVDDPYEPPGGWTKVKSRFSRFR